MAKLCLWPCDQSVTGVVKKKRQAIIRHQRGEDVTRLPDEQFDAWLLERFGLPLSHWDNEDWPRLMRALEVQRIERVETLRLQQQQGLVAAKDISQRQWEEIMAHDQLLAEVGEEDGAIVN